MYFGAMAIGADTAIGMMAMFKIRKTGKNISLIFKDFKCNFLKRAEGDTVFICTQGMEMSKMIDEVIASKERINKAFQGQAIVNGEVVAEFELTLSLKLK